MVFLSTQKMKTFCDGKDSSQLMYSNEGLSRYITILFCVWCVLVCYFKRFTWKWDLTGLDEVWGNKLPIFYGWTCWPRAWWVGGWRMEPSPGLLDVPGCPGSVITVLMLSPSKVQYCDNWRMAANLTRVRWFEAGWNEPKDRREERTCGVEDWRSRWWDFKISFVCNVVESL